MRSLVTPPPCSQKTTGLATSFRKASGNRIDRWVVGRSRRGNPRYLRMTCACRGALKMHDPENLTQIGQEAAGVLSGTWSMSRDNPEMRFVIPVCDAAVNP